MRPMFFLCICAAASAFVALPQDLRADYLSFPEYRSVERQMQAMMRGCVEDIAAGYGLPDQSGQCTSSIYGFCQDNGPFSDSTLGMTACGSATGRLLDEELNRVWAQIKRHASKREFAAILDKQRSWLRHRKDEADAAADAYRGGSMAEVVWWSTYVDLTATRLTRLYQILHGL